MRHRRVLHACQIYDACRLIMHAVHETKRTPAKTVPVSTHLTLFKASVLTYNTIFWYTEILQPALKAFAESCLSPMLQTRVSSLKGKVILRALHAFYTSVGGVIYANEPIHYMKLA